MKDSLYHYRAVIVHVYDGDTVVVDVDLGLRTWHRDVKLRLFGVDTPEIRGPERPDGLISRDRVREWCPVGAEVTLETHKDKTGKFGRWLATIWPDGWDESVNGRLIREGLAEAYLP